MPQMPKGPLALLTCIMMSAGPGQAGQPIHMSMADCAGILLGVSDVIETPHRKTYFLEVSRIWADVAARTAGRDMSHRVDETAAAWRDKGLFVGFSQDYKDWMSYCGALARDRRISIPKPP